MKSKSNKKPNVQIVTLGCSKNWVDSEVLHSQLKYNDIPTTHETHNKNSNIVIINTCGFIDKAKQQSIDTILAYSEEKNKGNIEKLYVTGCLSERYKTELPAELPEVDGFFGTMDLPNLLNVLGADYKKELIGERLTSTPSHYAYLKISEGCDRPCSFCAIPLMRGKHVSRSIESLVEEAKFLITRGVKELLLIAQDSTYYGIDIYGKRRLADLLTSLSAVKGIEWIRLHYAFPSGFPLDILEVMKSKPNICNYLDIPLQHISDNLLQSMKRGINGVKIRTLIQQMRESIPNITLRTTFIVGYPGETEKEFKELIDFVQVTKFDRVGVFTYSHEENTTAFQLEDTVPQEVKEERARLLMETQQLISYQLNQQKIGKTFTVLIDKKEKNHYIGRTEADSPEVDNEVIVESANKLIKGEMYNVKIQAVEDYDLIGIVE